MNNESSQMVFAGLPTRPARAARRRLRVCIASPEFIGLTRNGGIGTAYSAMAHALTAAGHEVTCLYLEGEIVASRDIRYWVDKYQSEGLTLIPLPAIKSPSLDAPHHEANSYEAYAWLKQHDHFDIIHFPEWRGPGFFTINAKRQGLAFAKSVICVGTHSTTRWVMAANREFITDLAEIEKDFMERQSVEFADVVVSPSQYLLRYITDCGWKLPAASFVQQNILPASASRVETSRFEHPQPVSEIVFFGRLETRKGVVLFCDALDRLAAAKPAQLRTITFLGKEAAIEGVLARGYLKKRSQKWPWPMEIISDRDQPQAMQYLSEPGRLAVIPSLTENSPYTVLECLGARISFIASRVGGIPELISPDDLDRVCFAPKPADLAAHLAVALSTSFKPARPAIDAQANERAWLAWHESLLAEPGQTVAQLQVQSHPKVTLGLVTFNRPRLLRQALSSIEALDYPNFEVVLVDDGSTAPDAIAALDELEAPFARRGWKIVRQENRYLGAARNTAARHATGEYLLFMDDDNFAEPHEISVLVRVALRTGADIVACGMNYFPGQDAPDLKTLPKGRWLPLGGCAAAGALRNCFGDANALVRRSCFESLGGFTEVYGVTHEDWEFHAKAVLKGFTLTVIPEFLFWYRISPDSMIRTLERYHNYMRGIRPYLEAVPESIRDLIYFAQAQQLRLTNTVGARPLDAAETRLNVAWRSKWEAARVLLQQKQSAAAMDLLIAAVKAVEDCQRPIIIFEALTTVGQELLPLDRERAETLLKLALNLAKALQRDDLQEHASKLIQSAALPTKSHKAKSSSTPSKPVPVSGTPTPVTGPVAPAEVSIIIPVFNNLRLTQACLASVAANRSASLLEVIVVDNASTDGSREFLEAERDAGRLRLVTNQHNEGFAHGCNQGAQVARGSLLLFLNNDTTVTPGWLEALVAAARRPRVGIVGAKLLYANGTIQHAGIGFINGIPDHPHRHAPADAREVNQFLELDMVTGACLLIHRDLLFQLMGFDEAYRNGVEDVDLCLRARAAGWKVVYEPKAVVYHLEGQSAGRFDQVNENLRLFFNRWKNSFDGQMKYVAPQPPKLIPADCSLLRTSSPRAGQSAITVAWEGSFLDFGSLSHVNRQLTCALSGRPEVRLVRVGNPSPNGTAVPPELKELARSLSSNAPKGSQITVRHAWPPNWRPAPQGHTVVIQPWEFGSLPAEWVAQSAGVTEFWVPSEYVKRVYLESGIPAEKVAIVPNGVDTTRFAPEASPFPLNTTKRFKFLFVGGTIFRKGPDLLLKAYLESFTAADDVCLVIKDFGQQSVYRGQTLEAEIEAARGRPNAPEIVYLRQDLAPEALPGLYAACDCLVHPYRGEGFGLPVLEAMAVGLPVIVTARGATDDFALEPFALKIPAARRAFGQEVSGMKLAGPGWMIEPDLAVLKERMRWAFNHPDQARERGRAGRKHACEKWTWNHAADAIVLRLRALATLPVAPAVTSKPAALTRAPAKPKAIALPACGRVGELAAAREALQQKKFQPAWESSLAAIAKRPFHPEALLLLAQIAQAVGAGQEARLCAEAAKRMAPGWKPARQFLNQRLKGGNRPGWLHLPAVAVSPSSLKLSVCLIARNEEQFLGRCLESVKEVADQIVVVDTGSTDRTVEIARAHGAEIHTFDWCDDFSAARNEMLRHVTGDWVLALDADEELAPDALAKLRAAMADAAVMAWRLPIVDVGREAEGCAYVPRLFRNAPGLFYVGRIHEQVFSSLEVRRTEWGLENRVGEATLIHHGYVPEIMRDRKKIERNLGLLERAITELPGEPHLIMNLGLELARSGRESEALARYREAFEVLSSKPASEVVPELRETLLIQLCARLLAARQFAEVDSVLTSRLARSAGGLNASHHFALGLAQMELGRFPEAAEQMRQCLEKRGQRSFAPINPDIQTAAPHHCLAQCFLRLDAVDQAIEAFEAGLAARGHGDILRLDYARFLHARGRSIDALHRLHEIVGADPSNVAAWRLGGQIALSQPQFLQFALDWTGEALRNRPDDNELAAQRAEILLLTQDPAAGDLWARVASQDAQPRSRAAWLLAEIVSGDLRAGKPPADGREEIAISRAFLDWYRKLIAVQALESAAWVNDRIEDWRAVLPTAAKVLNAALVEAREVEPAVVAR